MPQKLYYDKALLKSETPNGQDWLEKVLHPPGEKGQSYNGFPDKSVVSCIHSEFRLDNSTTDFTNVTGTSSPSRVFLHSPSVLYPVLQATRLSPSQEPTWVPVVTNNNLDRPTIRGQISSSRLAYKSATVELDATAFNNSGMSYVSQFCPGIFQYDLGTIVQRYASNHSAEKLFEFLDLIENTYNAHDDVETIKAMYTRIGKTDKHTGRMYNLADVEHDLKAVNISSNPFQVVQLGKPPLSPGDVSQLSPKSFKNKAVEGQFIIAQLDQDTNPFKSIDNAYIAGTGQNGLIASAYEYETDSGATYIEPFLLGAGAINIVQDMPWGPWSWAYQFIVGLTPVSATSPAATSSIKVIIGLESTPLPRTMLEAQTSPPAVFDPEAIKSYCRIVQSRQDAMDSSYNEGGLGAALQESVAPALVEQVMAGAKTTPTQPPRRSSRPPIAKTAKDVSDKNFQTAKTNATENAHKGGGKQHKKTGGRPTQLTRKASSSRRRNFRSRTPTRSSLVRNIINVRGGSVKRKRSLSNKRKQGRKGRR